MFETADCAVLSFNLLKMANPNIVLPLLAVRGSFGVDLIQGQQEFKEMITLLNDSTAKTKAMTFSKDGSYFAYCDGQNLKVLSTSSGDVILSVPKQKTIAIVFSPKNRYLACWEPFYTTPQNPNGSNNFEMYEIESQQCLRSQIYKKQSNWKPLWTSDEEICGRCVSNEVQFYSNQNMKSTAHRLLLQNVEAFSFSPGPTAPYYLAAFVVGKKASPSCVRMFKYPEFGDGKAIANKSFFKADKVNMIWNKKGTGLLILTSTEVDTTGQSYYGEQTLHFMTITGETSHIQFEKRGPIYSVNWSPNSSQFCVVYGYMPAKATLFNMKCETVFDFGTGPRNTCKFNKAGNILCLAGFGNLPGSMEMWNVDGRKLITKIQAPDTTNMEWCPDSQHFVTSTCAPRLRVSNGYKIWHYTGHEKYRCDTPKNFELWQVLWQSQLDGVFAVPKISTIGVKKEVKQEVYRPPGVRNLPQVATLIDHRNAENQGKTENLSANALKNKKKREARKAKQAAEDEQVQYSSSSTNNETENSVNESLSSGNPETDKRIKAIKKKLRQIEELKAKQKQGIKLENNQLEKLKSENTLLKELNGLSIG